MSRRTQKKAIEKGDLESEIQVRVRTFNYFHF